METESLSYTEAESLVQEGQMNRFYDSALRDHVSYRICYSSRDTLLQVLVEKSGSDGRKKSEVLQEFEISPDQIDEAISV